MLRIHLRASKTPGLLGPPDLRPLVPSTYGARWPFSVLAPVNFRPVSAPGCHLHSVKSSVKCYLCGFPYFVFLPIIKNKKKETKSRIIQLFKDPAPKNESFGTNSDKTYLLLRSLISLFSEYRLSVQCVTFCNLSCAFLNIFQCVTFCNLSCAFLNIFQCVTFCNLSCAFWNIFQCVTFCNLSCAFC